MGRLAELLDEARAEVREMKVDEVRAVLDGCDGKPLLFDIREREATVLGYIRGATHIPENVLQMHAETVIPAMETPVLLYCGTGVRSLLTAKMLKDLGYKDVRTLMGGLNAWKDAGYEVVSDSSLSPDQLSRYSRQIILKDIGEEGQIRLLQARVLIVGAGGLGSPIALYLAECGVGTLGIVDFDTVDFSNLNRQVLHIQANVGRPKTESAKEAIQRANPEVKVITFEERLEPHNAIDLIHDFDIVVDGADNIPTKYLLNDAAFFAGKPFVFGAAIRFEGQASVFSPKDGGPCLRCMFPKPPEPADAPTWSDVGVLGVVPGQIGLVQATETLKLILKKGTPMLGKFLVYHALDGDFRTFNVKRNPACPLCGAEPTIRNLTNCYEGMGAIR